MLVDSAFFRNCKSVGARYHVDADYGCPAFFHVGKLIYCQRFFAEKCFSEKRCIAASLVTSKIDLPLQTNMTSLENCQINSGECNYILGYGNVIFNDVNTSFVNSNILDPGVHAGYSPYKSFHEYCIFYHGRCPKGFLPTNSNSVKCRNIMIHSAITSEQLLYQVRGYSLSIENSYFFNNTKNNFNGIIKLINCFYDKDLTGVTTENCFKIIKDPLTSYLPNLYFQTWNCFNSNNKYCQMKFGLNVFLIFVVLI